MFESHSQPFLLTYSEANDVLFGFFFYRFLTLVLTAQGVVIIHKKRSTPLEL